MPKYKSLLGVKTTRGGTKSGGTTKSAGAVKSGGAVKSAGSISSGGSISAGSVDSYDNNIDKVMRFIESDPMLLLDLLELMDSRSFSLFKEISNQRIGKKSAHHPQYIGELEKKNDLYGPHKDIANNARDMNHLISGLHTELQSNPKGGGLFKSIKNNIKTASKFVSNKVRQLPKIDKIQKKTNMFLNKVSPIIKGVDEFTSLVSPEIPQLSPFVRKAQQLVNNKIVNQASKVQHTIDDALKPKDKKKDEIVEE